MALYTPAPGSENPSPAFLAGQQHGAALAQQHHVARTAAPKVAKPAKAVQTVPGTLTLNDLLAQAQGIARSQTAAQVQAIKAQQALYGSQAKDRANQMVAASQAAAQLLASLGLGDQTAKSYTDAAQALAGLAQGFSGQTQTDATNAANTVAAQAAKLGAPAGSVQTATGQTSNPQALANVSYGLGGFIPGNLLLTEGQTQAAQQRGLPANFLSYGNQMAAGELASGQSQADALTQNILNAQSQEPSLYQSILSSLGSQATNQALAQSLIGSRNTTSQNNTSKLTGVGPNGQTLPGYLRTPNGIVKVPPGYEYDPKTGRVIKIPPPPKPKAPPKPLTAGELRSVAGTANTIAENAFSGFTDSKGTAHPILTYQGALNELRLAGLLADPRAAKVALGALNRVYAPGVKGRPVSKKTAKQWAKSSAWAKNLPFGP